MQFGSVQKPQEYVIPDIVAITASVFPNICWAVVGIACKSSGEREHGRVGGTNAKREKNNAASANDLQLEMPGGRERLIVGV